MLSVLANRTYRHLFAAQVVALAGTGLATVALALLAYDIAGEDAGAVLGTALAIKMVAYVGIAPVAGAFADKVPRRALLIAMDLARASVAVLLPFVDQVWQIYVLIFVLQACSAVFTPAFQATIPDVLPEERDYTKALSLSRLAYDLESLLSPTLAAALLAFISFQWLFLGTAVGFVGSSLLVLSVLLPKIEPSASTDGVYDKITKGIRIFVKTPRLLGLLMLTLAAASAGAMVIVNTVVILRDTYARPDTDVALALAAYGGGSMLAALLLPKLLASFADRGVMLVGAVVIAAGLLGAAPIIGAADAPWAWPGLLAAWFLLGTGYSAILTPSGRLLRRSSAPQDRPALFAAQFALSHACWLITYPLAGLAGAAFGMPITLMILAGIAAVGLVAALTLWPRRDPETVEHFHEGLRPDHPHLTGARQVAGGYRQEHRFAIDDIHTHWPSAD